MSTTHAGELQIIATQRIGGRLRPHASLMATGQRDRYAEDRFFDLRFDSIMAIENLGGRPAAIIFQNVAQGPILGYVSTRFSKELCMGARAYHDR